MNLLFFGDSICNGQGIAIHKGWVTRLSACLTEQAQRLGNSLVVMNSSVNGRSTRQALETMPYDVQSHKPEIVIVQFGMNDCNIWESDRGNPRVSPAAFEANLREIIQRALTFGCRELFLHTNHPSGRDQSLLPHANVTYEEQNRLYNQIIRNLAGSDSRVSFIDIEAAFLKVTNGERSRLIRLVMPDLLHLSEEGHELYFNTVEPSLRASVVRLIGRRLAA
jgi:lysophospholipase L1-like esterase